ncbi:MAG: hypothetical protein PVH87_24095 [Desulfobacteraceae bacterium]|jgi:hypothetical protein
MDVKKPEKVRLLEILNANGFNVPSFIYLTPDDFKNNRFEDLDGFLNTHCDGFKVIARSAHIDEECFKSGTFDSFGTYADVGGIKYARKKMIRKADTTKRLSIRRQQHFNNAPKVDLEQMGVMVMPFIEGTAVMAKTMGDRWEFGYCRDRSRKIQREPYITQIPHDRRLVQLSRQIEETLGFRCEIEYIVSTPGDIFVVQAKDISHIETLELKESERSIKLAGIRRIRKRRSYRERPLYVLDNRSFYINLISKCEDMVLGCEGPKPQIEDLVATIKAYEADMERFALRNHRYAVLGLSIQEADDLYQIASHYLDETPEIQAQLSTALHDNVYQVDIFLAEADTLIAKDKVRINLGSHDAYGIDTVRNPLWSAYWHQEQHDAMVAEFRRLGFKTGDTVGIEIDGDEKPTIYRL